MKTAEEQISGDSGSINGTRPDPMPWNMRDECEAFPRLDLSSEGLDRECEMARRRVMAHVHDFIGKQASWLFHLLHILVRIFIHRLKIRKLDS